MNGATVKKPRRVAAIKHPVQYKSCVIAPVAELGGYDVFDGQGRWFHMKTQKRAKWWASIHDSLQRMFDENSTRAVPQVNADENL